MNAKHSSESAEHYSPQWVVDFGRGVQGGIDVDPASSARANKIVCATTYFTKTTNGYNKPWKKRVFINPPGGLCEFETGRPVLQKTKSRESCTVTGSCGKPAPHHHEGVTSSAKAWWYQLVERYMRGETWSALFVGFSMEIIQSTQVDLPNGKVIEQRPAHFPMVFPDERIKFLALRENKLEPGEQPTHANALIYLPRYWNAAEQKNFYKLSEQIGDAIWPSRRVER